MAELAAASTSCFLGLQISRFLPKHTNLNHSNIKNPRVARGFLHFNKMWHTMAKPVPAVVFATIIVL